MKSPGFGVKQREQTPFLSPRSFQPSQLTQGHRAEQYSANLLFFSHAHHHLHQALKRLDGRWKSGRGSRRLNHWASHPLLPWNQEGRASSVEAIDTYSPGLVGRSGRANERAEDKHHPQPGGVASGTRQSATLVGRVEMFQSLLRESPRTSRTKSRQLDSPVH